MAATTPLPAESRLGRDDLGSWRPGVRQTVFVGLVTVDLTVRVAVGRIDWWSWPLVALVLAATATVLAWAGPWDRLPMAAVAVLPVIDIAAIGVSRLAPLNVATGALIILPGYWLGRTLGRVGMLAALFAGLLLLSTPNLLVLEPTADTVTRSLLLPVVGAFAAWAAQSITATVVQLRHERAVAEADRDRLAGALEFIEHQGRISDAIVDTVDTGLLLLDAEGNYQSVNRRHRDFMRVAFPEGHLGRVGQVGLIFDEAGDRRLTGDEMPTTRAARGEEFDDFRIWVGDDPLTWRAMSVSARSVRDDDGTFRGAALAFNDVTDYMRALRVKDEFVASVSHELRTPLTSIRGYVDLMRDDDDLSPDAARKLEVVARNAERLGRLVADLLQSAQTDLGPMNVVRTHGDLAAIVRETVAAATPSAATAGVDLVADIPDSLEMLLDRDRMRQVADNLVSNGLKYTPRGGRVRVVLALDGDRAELRVEDTGIGIDARDRDQLFTRFFRSRHAEEQSIQGVGLGLSITKTIVESHGGRIEVDSELGSGSTFRVRLPVGVHAS